MMSKSIVRILLLHKRATETGHTFDFENTSILAYEGNTKKRKIRKVIEIINEKNSLNFKRDSEKLGAMYAPLFHRGY